LTTSSEVQDYCPAAFFESELKMRKHHIAVLFLLLPVAAKPQTPDEPLELHAEIKSERYCDVDDEISSLRVIFKVRLVNNGKVPVVIAQRTYPLLLVSRTLPNLQRGKHEFELHPGDSFSPPKSKPEQRVVRQGEVFESETMETAIPTPKTVKYSKLEALAPGMHYLQVVITAQLKDTLKFANAVSQPIEITILKNPKTENCQ
jgi:hypothetical protein